jgi:endonuclease YncB( thermonuclease family)
VGNGWGFALKPYGGPAQAAPAPAPTPVDQFDRGLLWRYRARLVAVHDGDTIDVLVDNGFRSRHQPAIRLFDVFADELWTPTGKAAQAALAGALTPTPDGWGLRLVVKQLETVVGEDTSFERWVADVVQVDAAGALHNIGDWMVANGWAHRAPTPKSLREGIVGRLPATGERTETYG